MRKVRTYSEEQKREAIAQYIDKGSFHGAAKALGIPWETIRSWRHANPDWWDQVTHEINEYDREKRMAYLARISDGSMNGALDRIENGDAKYDARRGTIVRVPVSARDLTMMFAVSIDKHRLLAGQPTSITSKTKALSGEDVLKAMKELASKKREDNGGKADLKAVK